MQHNDVLQAFLQAWLNKDYDQMFEFAQKTWKEGKTEKDVEYLFGPNPLKDFNVFSSTFVSDSAMKYNVDLAMENGTRLMSVVNVICEEAPSMPRRWGTWGVNPASVQNIVSKISPKEEKKEAPTKGGKKAPKKESDSK